MVATAPATEDYARLVAHWRGDLPAYARDVLVIRTKQAQLRAFDFNRAQRIVHHVLSTQLATENRVRAIILKARQEGISTYTAARFFRRVSLRSNQNALVIADQRKRGQVLFRIYEGFDRHIPAWCRPSKSHARRGWNIVYDAEAGGLNSILTVETAKDAAAGRGSTVQAVHASELAFWENPEEVWISLMQAVPDHGSEVIIESTANGVGNMFHQMWNDAEAGDSAFIAIFLPWWIHEEYRVLLSPEDRETLAHNLTEWEEKALTVGFELSPAVADAIEAGVVDLPLYGNRYRLDLEQIAWRRDTIRDKLRGDENVFKQEYPSTAREAFLVSGNCFFDEEELLAYEEAAKPPLGRYELTWKNSAPHRVRRPRGELRVWEPPRLDGEYVIFVDTATGRMSSERESIYSADREQGGRDFSCAWVYDTVRRRYVAKLHGRIPPEVFADKCYALGYLYPHLNPRTGNGIPALLGVERNHSSGETVLRRLKDDLNYPNLYRDRQMNNRGNRMTVAYGWVTTEAKRQVMLDEFSAAIREHSVWLPDADTIRECFTFIRGDTGKPEAQEGCHDDRVVSASGCLQMARHHYTPAIPSRRRVVRRGGLVGHLETEEE